MPRTEYRYVYDCESMEKVLQHRTVHFDGEGYEVSTPWETVPTVLGIIRNNEVVSVNGNKK